MKKVATANCIIFSILFFASTLTQAQHTFRTTSSGSIIGYMEYLPADYNTNSDKYPVVIFLHGVDERGVNSTDPATLQTTINNVIKLGPPLHVKNGEQFPFILITPQLKKSYGSWPAAYVKEVIDHCKTYLRIDERRIHITGLSMGGHGTWTCIQDMPKLFASAVPVCGANNSPAKACGIAAENVAVWAFHGDADPVVSYTKTSNMVNAINACSPAPNPAAKATIYANVQHNAWYRAYFLDNNYHTPNFFQWVMLQSKTKNGSNTLPLANAGPDKTVSSSSSSLSGSGSDSNGSISAYRWTQLKGPNNSSISSPTAASTNISGLTTGTYVFKFQVTDNGGSTDTDFVTVTVNGTGTNVSPVANAGSDKVISLPTTSTTLTGSATDSDGTIASYSWSKVSGGSATLSGATTTTLSLSGLTAGTYVFRLTAKDNKNATGSDDVTLIVNALPTVSAGADKSITLPLNSVSITGVASDADGSISSYAWTKPSGPSATLGGTTSATLTASGLVAGTYVFRLTVKDNRGSSSFDDVKVTVLAAPATNIAPVSDAGDDLIITLPSNSVSITGTGSDADGNITSYLWTKFSGGTATLSGTSTSTLSASGLTAGTYVFRLRVLDNQGGADTDDVTVIVNSPPVVSAGSDYTLTLPTNSTTIQGTATDSDGTIATYAWTKTSGGAATLSGTSTSKLTATGLVQGSYVFRLSVTDNRGASKFDDVKITVQPSVQNTPPPNDLPIAEAGDDRLITLPSNSVQITGTGSDSDGTISSYKWTKVSGGTATLSGTTTTSLSISNLVAGTYVFRLTVTDNNGGTNADDVTVIVNAPPVVSAGADFSITLPTNSLSVQGTASDPDGSIAKYNWTMTTGTIATLTNTNTSKLTATGLVEGRYVFRLFVTDNRGATKFDDVLIIVNPSSLGSQVPNNAPVANAGPDRLISLPWTSTVIYGSGSDSDGSISSYLWTKVSGPAATLSNQTTDDLSVSNLTYGTYTFRLTAVDNLGASHSDDVVLIVNSPPAANAGANITVKLPANSATIQGNGTDPDGTISSYNWEKTSGGSATLSGANTKTLSVTNLVEGTYVFKLTVTDNRGVSRYDPVTIYVVKGTTASAFADGRIEEITSLDADEVVDYQGELSAGTNNFWRNKKVTIYEATGKEIFSGQWSSTEYSRILSTGKLYIYNILTEEKRIRKGKFLLVD